ncbi:NAD(P)/FAD-dependent oxidoreductase [Rhizobium halophilum]|uniref:NAD(P)/FAD-dependent oxidoreductase n=1 Tax=Rhizobium halophilum TaxID=2846852 RepID=UPI001EFCB57B|nr:NAD(P)/FAD-dependent oxidoreductase [Rhizobium halophilum]MCF6371027.1 NAD(P)/FAD-dependent oxidoreductase [Rhizobium halophilum]
MSGETESLRFIGAGGEKSHRHVVIIGGGFGGLACARELGNSDVHVTVIDRRNHNLFQPLLYQVATAALSPADISEPIRRSLGRYRNIRVLMAEVGGIDRDTKRVALTDGGEVAYDDLVIATGSQYNYFGHDDWQSHAPGLKSIHEARQIRQRLLLAFEKAELSRSSLQKQALLTSIVIGGGPTGVEMAGAISELGRYMISRDYRALAPSQMRVILLEAGPRILASFPEHLSSYACEYLQKIGVEVRLSQGVSAVEEGRVTVGDEHIEAGCIVWGAGVKASPAFTWLGIKEPPGGRIPVDSHLQVVGLSKIYAIGDTAMAVDTDGKPLPALAQVAKQQGQYLGRLLGDPTRASKPFRFRNRGNTAVIGRHAAVFDFGRWTLKGRFAWLLWAVVHVYLLINFEKRVLVSTQWIWRYLTRQRGARIIDENAASIGDQKEVAQTNALIRR